MLPIFPAALVVAALGVPPHPAPHPAVRFGPVPTWVEAREPIPVPIAAQGPLFDLSEDDQVRIDGRRTARYHESIVAVGSREGLEQAAEWHVEFTPSFERLLVHTLEVERQGRRSDRLADARALVLQPATDGWVRIYDDTLTLVLVAADVRIGDRVRFAYTLEGTNPVFGDRFHGDVTLSWQTPIVRRTVRVLHRREQALAYRVHGIGPQPFVMRAGDDWRELRWRLTGFAAPLAEQRVPDDWFQEPFVQLSQFPAWSDVVEWALPLYRRGSDPELSAFAAELAPGQPLAERALAAVRFVQDDVRYFAAPIGPASHAPQPSVEVLRRRYGDCKDKARLLVDLLAQLGIEAWPAFVAGELHGAIRSFLPAPSAFDHVIVAVSLDGRTVWIDATDSLQGGAPGELYLSPFAVALEIRPGVTGLTELPVEASWPGTHELRYRYHFGGPGEAARVDIETIAQRFQADLLRRTLVASSADQLLDGYLDFYRRSGRAIEALAPTEAGIEDDRQTNRLTLRESYRLRDCLGSSPCELLPLLMTEELEAPFGGARRAPWRLTPDVHLRETITLSADDDRVFSPIAGQEVNPWFDFQVASTLRTDGLDIHYELRTLAPAVRVRDLSAYRRAVDNARKLMTYELHPAPPRRLVAPVGVVLGLLAVIGGLLWRRHQRQPIPTLALRRSAGWKWRSSRPSSGSPGSREV